MSTDDVLVVVPMFNEASTIGAVVSDLRRHFAHVLCVDDGSHDDSRAVAEACGATTIRHPVNLGQGAALQTGFDYLLRHTEAAYCLTFDADGQHRLEDGVVMTEHARARGLDVVLASRFRGRAPDMPLTRRLTLWAGMAFTRLYDGLEVTDTHNGLRVLSRGAVRSIRISLPRMAHASELQWAIARSGLSYDELPVEIIYADRGSRKGQSSLNAINILLDLLAGRLRMVP